jgi:outer membrane protein assembly factor BamB
MEVIVNHRRFLISSIVAGGFLAGAGALAAELEQAWQVTGLDGPESAVLDATEGVLYVSNVNGEPAAADGNGYISKLSLAGEIQDKEWVTGLNAPKGLALHDGKLYVSDIDELVVIDTASGEITARHKAPGATFLNDVTAHQDGRVFVSDMMQNQIWKLEGDQFEVWVEDQALENPNGLLAEQDRLVVGAWGKPNEDFSTDVPGHLKAVDYQSKEITSIGPGDPIGNLDGVEPDGQGGYLVTDWFSGGLYDIGADGKAEMIMDLNQGSADHEFVEDENLAVIPMMMDGTVNAYKIR